MATKKPKSRKSVILEWTGWKRPSEDSMSNLLETPKALDRESFRNNVPQEWLDESFSDHDAPARNSRAMMKHDNQPNPIDIMIKIITDVFALLQGFIWDKLKF